MSPEEHRETWGDLLPEGPDPLGSFLSSPGGAALRNPLIARQVAVQRATNPRPDVTDLFGYGPTWQTYWQNFAKNLAAQFQGLGTKENFMGPFGFGGITAFHGSPHLFSKFDMSKVGTGEGAQAYGHGLYFAENPQVAKSYNTPLREAQAWNIDGQRANGMTTRTDAGPLNYAANALERFDGNIKEAAAWAREGGKQSADWAAAAKILSKAKSASRDAGNLYKVDIPDEAVGRMLDWDKPLHEQSPEVRAALKKIPLAQFADDAWTGEEFLRFLENQLSGTPSMSTLRDPVKASAALREAGIPGIKYLDQGSRNPVRPQYRGDSAYLAAAQSIKQYGMGVDDAMKAMRSAYKQADEKDLQAAIDEAYDIAPKQTSNFVVFDDQLPKILGRE